MQRVGIRFLCDVSTAQDIINSSETICLKISDAFYAHFLKKPETYSHKNKT